MPLMPARYARIRADETLDYRVRATGSIACVLRGQGEATCGTDSFTWGSGEGLQVVLRMAPKGDAGCQHRSPAHSADDDPAAGSVAARIRASFLEAGLRGDDRGLVVELTVKSVSGPLPEAMGAPRSVRQG